MMAEVSSAKLPWYRGFYQDMLNIAIELDVKQYGVFIVLLNLIYGKGGEALHQQVSNETDMEKTGRRSNRGNSTRLSKLAAKLVNTVDPAH
jgi:hypothetical protein